MRRPVLGSIASLLLGVGAAVAQTGSTQQVVAVSGAPTASEPVVIIMDESGASSAASPRVAGIGSTPRAITIDAQSAMASSTPSHIGTDDGGDCNRLWISAEYLLYWIKPAPLPVPIVNTTTNGGFGPLPGLFRPDAVTLIGKHDIELDPLSGGRFTADYALNSCYSLEGSIFFLLQKSNNQSVGSTGADGSPVLYRPLINVTRSTVNGGVVIAFPGEAAGGVLTKYSSDMWGAQLNVVQNVARNCNCHVDLFAGFRYVNLEETFEITDRTTAILPNGLALGARFGGVLLGIGDTTSSFDHFNAKNAFYGGQVGARVESCFGQFSLTGKFQIGLGNTEQTVDIRGISSLVTAGGATSTLPGGLLALPSNSGHFEHDQFSVVSEVGVALNYDIDCNTRVWIGYDLLSWTNLARPGNAIDLAQEEQQNPRSGLPPPGGFNQVGARFPAPPGKGTADLWVQGFNLGIGFRY